MPKQSQRADCDAHFVKFFLTTIVESPELGIGGDEAVSTLLESCDQLRECSGIGRLCTDMKEHDGTVVLPPERA